MKRWITPKLLAAQVGLDWHFRCAKIVEELYRLMNGKSLKEIDEIIYAVCTLCRDHEKAGFLEGVKVGVLLAKELNTP